ncbi:MAG: 60S ribosomal protein L31 [Nitrosarchaeum sp.]|nr:60S ribosomal protein L31 [Nitrosarchaeum sp.]MCV0398466.1 60S ribosomal protein L31 [Nitrosarchaeum sp.]
MSQELERVYTINLGKALISQSQHRAVRAINMIKEFARHHMKIEDIKIEEDLAHQIWSKGVRNPPRKIRVRMSKTDEGYVLVSPYDEEVEDSKKESKETKKETKKVEDKVEPAKEATIEDKLESTKEIQAEDKAEPTKESTKKEPSKTPKKEASKESTKTPKKAKPSKSK